MNEFEKLVFKMRKYQKDYFKTREKYALEMSKKCEQEVDEHLKNINQPKIDF